MTQPALTYADCANASPIGQSWSPCLETANEAPPSERRSPRLGLLVILTTAVAFYGGIAALIWKPL